MIYSSVRLPTLVALFSNEETYFPALRQGSEEQEKNYASLNWLGRYFDSINRVWKILIYSMESW